MAEKRTKGLAVWTATAGLAVVVAALFLIAPALAATVTPVAKGATPNSPGGPCATGNLPGWPAWNPVKHWMYIPNEFSGNITVLSGTCHLVGTITLPLGAEPIAMAFDPANNWMYVTDDGLNAVYGISGLTVKVTITSPLITAPIQIIWDPGDSMLLLTNDYGSFSVTGIQANVVVGSVGVGDTPQGICYDPFYNTVLVVNRFSQNVTILSGYSPLSLPLTKSVGVGSQPRGCVFDVANNYDYIVNQGNDNVTVMSGLGFVAGSVNVGQLPAGIGWDQATLRVMVANTLHGGISVINGFTVTKTIKAGIKSPQGMAYDGDNNEMYISGGGSNLAYIEP